MTFFTVQQPLEDETILLIIEASRLHSDTPHLVGLLWTSDQPDADTSTSQHTKLTTDRHPCPWRDSNPQAQQASDCRPTPWTARPLGSAISLDTNNKSINTNIGHTNSVSTCPCMYVRTTKVRSYILNYWTSNTQNNLLQQYNYLSLPSRTQLTRVLIRTGTYPTQ